MKMHRITGGLFQRGAAHEVDRDDKLATLRAEGVTMVINMALHPDDDIRGSKRIRYYHLPIPDSKVPPMEPLLMLAGKAADHIRSGGGVLVQCHAGRNRSGFMSALIVRALTGCSGAEAMEVVRAGRKNAIANPEFEAYLLALEAKEN
jgi:protein-tyrosine phosphatase